ncbi:MAG: efflux RND transporter periplasmic adaptor subunit [Candidatus Omnitrophota bacterium]|jgi:multidrug efflux pump subunit AcrA (membrane-fusion protein)
MSKTVKILLVFILVIGVVAGLHRYNTRFASRQPGVKKISAQKTTVKVEAVKKGDLNLILSYVGSLKARDEADVFSKVAGKLARYEVKEGDAVVKGQAVALVDRDETGLKYALAPVESPLAGIVGKTLLDKGASIQASGGVVQGTSLAVVVDMDEMLVKLNVSEQDIPYFQDGLKAKINVDAYPGQVFEGTVTRVSQIVDSQTRTLPVEISILNQDHRLKSGMFGRIFINAAVHEKALILSQDTLVEELGHNYVFVEDKGTARKQKVVTGIRDNGSVEIVSGVQAGDTVIVFGQQGLKDGAAVEVEEENAVNPARENVPRDQQGARE